MLPIYSAICTSFGPSKKAKASPGSPPRAWPIVHLIASRIWGEIAPKFERRPFEKMGRLMINYTNLEVQKMISHD